MLRWLSCEVGAITSLSKDMEILYPSYIDVDPIGIGAATLKNNLAFPQKVKHAVTM